MLLEGIVQNGVVVFQSGQELPEGTRVQIAIVAGQEPKPTLRDRLLRLAGTVDDLPADMARNHDHYIHGAPKK